MKSIIHKIGNIKLEQHNNGSWSYHTEEGKRRNINSELAKKIIGLNVVRTTGDRLDEIKTKVLYNRIDNDKKQTTSIKV